ncbi:MAG: hypothetical protein ACTSPI_10795 [Candidatus Heimdallarchaeaceae archaeon]
MDEKTSIKIVSAFLRNHGYDPKRLKANKVSGQKTPDFEVYKNGSPHFLCELKTLTLIPNPVTNMFHWNTTVSKIREHISKGYKQLSHYDKKHDLPWIMFFVSTHFQLNWTNMVHGLRGVVGFNGEVIKDLTDQRFIQATDSEVKQIDAFIWSQVNAEKKRVYQLVHFVNANSSLLDATNDIVDKLIPYEDEEIMDKNSRKYKAKK